MLKGTDNPHLKLMSGNYDKFIVDHINNNRKGRSLEKVKVLDIGGGKGWGKALYEKDWIEYYALDLNSNINRDGKINYIKGDITDAELNLTEKFDIVFTKDTFEHILNPWDATQNVLNSLKDGGLFVFLAPFSWRYHATPYDTYRYTHVGAQYLFERLGGMKMVESGYIRFPKVKTAGFWKNKKDRTFDSKPFVDPIGTVYIGKRDFKHQFDTSDLDNDFDWKHEK